MSYLDAVIRDIVRLTMPIPMVIFLSNYPVRPAFRSISLLALSFPADMSSPRP